MKTLTKAIVCLLALAGVVLPSRAALVSRGNLQAVFDPGGSGVSPGFVLSNGIPNGAGAAMGGVWLVVPTNTARLSNTLVFGPSVIVEPNGATSVEFGGGATNAFTLFTTNQQSGATNIWAPSTLTGNDPSFSIESWVLAPTVGNYATIAGWGNSSTSSNQLLFNYGNSGGNSGGNVGGALNLGSVAFNWGPGGAPAAGVYHYLVTTFDGTTLSVYSDGVLMNQSTAANLGISGNTAFSPATNYPINIGSSRTSTANANPAQEQGSILTTESSSAAHARFHIAKVRIMDGVLTPADIANNYAADKATYQSLTPSTLAHLPTHDWVFTGSPGADATGAVVTDTGTLGNANATIRAIPGSGFATYVSTTIPSQSSALNIAGGVATNCAFIDFGTNLIMNASTVATNNGLAPGSHGYMSSPGTGTGQVTAEGWVTLTGHPGQWASYFEFGESTATNFYELTYTTNMGVTNTITNYITTNCVNGRVIGDYMYGQNGPGGAGSGNGQTAGTNSGFNGVNFWLLQQNGTDPTSLKAELSGSTNNFYGGYASTPATDNAWYTYGDNEHQPGYGSMTYFAMQWNEATHEVFTYINGEMVLRQITDKMMYMIDDANDTFGRDFYYGNAEMEGNVYELRMYSNILSPAEILGNFELGPNRLNTTALTTPNDIHLVRTTSSTNVAGSVAYFNITADYPSATGVNVTPNAVTYSSDNTSVVTVQPGLLQFLSPGTANVTATYQDQHVTVPITVAPLNPTTPELARRYKFYASEDGYSPYDEVTATTPYPYGYNFIQGGILNVGVLITNGAANGTPGWVDFGPNFISPTMDAMTVEMWASFGAPGGTAPLFYFGDQHINANGLVYLPNGNGLPSTTANPNRGRYSISAYSRPNLQLTWSADDPGLGGQVVYNLVDTGALDNTKNDHIVFELNPTAGYATIYLNGNPVTASNLYLPLLNTLVDNYNYLGVSGDSGYLPEPPGSGMNLPGNVSPGGNCSTNDMVVQEFRIWNGILPQSNVIIDLATGPSNIIIQTGTLLSNNLTVPNSLLVGQTGQASLNGYFQNVSNVNLFLYSANTTVTSSSPGVASVTATGVVQGVAAGTAYIIADVPGFNPVSNLVTIFSITPILLDQWSFNTNSGVGGSNWDSVQQVFNATNMNNAYVSNGMLVLHTNGNGGGDYEALPPNVITGLQVLSIEAWASFTNDSGTNANYCDLWCFGTTNSYGNGAYYMNFEPHSGEGGPGGDPAAPNVKLGINPTDPGSSAGGGEIDVFGVVAYNPASQTGLTTPDPLDHQSNVQIVATFHPFGGYFLLYTNGVLARGYNAAGTTGYGGSNTLGTTAPTALNLLNDATSYLGRDSSPNNPYTDCTIDEFRIYQGVLGQQQVALNYTIGPNNFVNLAAPAFVNSHGVNVGNLFVNSLSLQVPATNVIVDTWQTFGIFGSGSNSINQYFTNVSLEGAFITNVTGSGLDSYPSSSVTAGAGVIQVLASNVTALEPGTATLTVSYTAENPNATSSSATTTTVSTTATFHVTYGPGLVEPVHRWSFNEPAFSPVDYDSISGLTASNQWTAAPDGLGHLILDGTSNLTALGSISFSNVIYPFVPAGTNGLFAMAVTQPGFLSSGGVTLSNATFECWFYPSNTTAYGRIFDCGADVDSTIDATNVSSSNCYFTLVDFYGGANSEVSGVIKPTNSGYTYDVYDIVSGAAIPATNWTHIALVWDQSAGYGVIYTNGVLSTTVLQEGYINNPLSSVNDLGTIFGKSHYIGNNVTVEGGISQQTGPNVSNVDPPLAGEYDELRVWSAAMDSNQVHASFLAGPNVLPGPTLTLKTNATGFVITYPYWGVRSYSLYSSPTLLNPVWTPAVTGTPTTNIVNGAISSVSYPITPGSSRLFYTTK